MKYVLIVCCMLFAVGTTTTRAAGLRYATPDVESFHPLVEEPAKPSVLASNHPAILECKTTMFEDKEVLDFEKRQISFGRFDKIYNLPVWQYRYDELDDYLESRRKFALINGWYTSNLSLLTLSAEKKKGLPSLQWELQVQYPSWAQRFLGKDPPKLSMSGYEKIIVSYNYEKTDNNGTNVDLKASQGPQFDQENQFNIQGSVGRLINVNIKGSTKEGLDAGSNPLKNFKLEYKGQGEELEDEVIQEVVAGYTGFSMPGSELSGFSQSKEGLFGIKINGKIGPLSLTGIASQEQGESQTQVLYPAGGESNASITEKEFIQNKIFFLDKIYRDLYIGKVTSAPIITQLQVWRSNNTIKSEENASRTNKDGNQNSNRYEAINKTNQTFKLLVEDRDYVADKEKGWIRFDTLNIEDGDVLGVYLKTNDPTIIPERGFDFIDSTKKQINDSGFYLIKLPEQRPTDSTFSLMWRNVYKLPGSFEPTKFKLRMTRAAPDTLIDKTKSGLFFSQIVGLTDDKGVPDPRNSDVYKVAQGIIILPPWGKDTSGNNPFANTALEPENMNKSIYDTVGTDFSSLKAKFQITMSGSMRKTQFQLGFGSIMLGTEILKMAGTNLVLNKDYVIDYQTGQLDLISNEAKNASQIDVTFQSEALFVPKSKVFLGLHGEMKLPFGNNSLIGASILYQDASSQERVPKLKQEPYKKLLLDVNAKVDFEPEWMTKAVNLIPLLSTDAKSSVTIDMEVAHSRTNPNSSVGKDAYIDDFESSKQSYDITTSWYQSSPPPLSDAQNTKRSMLLSPPAWLQYWYMPFGTARPRIAEILKNPPKKVGATTEEQYENVFNFVCQPSPSDNALANRFIDPWAGITYVFPNGTTDRSKDRYLEFWAKNTGGGRLYFDFGKVSEDISLDGQDPNKKVDFEDDTANPNVYNVAYDNGLDREKDKDEKYYVPNATGTGWDTLFYGDERLPYKNDPHKDNYQTYENSKNYLANYPFSNGTEKNGPSTFNSEDIRGDGWSETEEYFRRCIDFDKFKDAAFLSDSNQNNYQVPDNIANAKSQAADTGWHLYRIPLNDTTGKLYKKNGGPKWSDIRFMRMWWSNFKKEKRQGLNTVQFARMRFVGNQWLDVAKRKISGDTSSPFVTKVIATSINTEDNKGTYEPPPSLYLQKDENGNYQRESSLQLEYDSIAPGDTGIVRRLMPNQLLDLSPYKNVSIMIHGDDAVKYYPDTLWYFLRIGIDDSTYYECRTPVTTNWKAMTINIKDLTDLKLKYQLDHPGTDSIFTKEILQNGDVLTIRASRGKTPSISAVSWMGMGIYRKAGTASSQLYSGAIWVDELKVTGVRELNGIAGRMAFSTKWADFIDFSLALNYEDGNFRRMTETNSALDNSTLSGNLSLGIKLDKFLPAAWGMSFPASMIVQQQLSRPQLKPSSDIFLTNDNGSPDDFTQMYKEMADMILGYDPGRDSWVPKTDSRHYQTASVTRTYNASISKKTLSNNPFVGLTLDRISLESFSYSEAISQTRRGEISETVDNMDVDTTQTYHGAIKYDLSPKPAPDWTKWKPFDGSKISWLPDRVKGYELSLLPTTLTFDIAEMSYSRQSTVKAGGADTRNSKRMSLDHRANFAYDPINILNLTYNIAVSRNLDDQANTVDLQKEYWQFFRQYIAKADPQWGKFGVLFGERSRTQGGSLRFDPSFLEWLSHSFDYTTSFNQTATKLISDNKTSYMKLGSDGTFHVASTLNMASLFKNFADGFANTKSLAITFGSIQKAMEQLAFNSISFDYSAKSSLTNENVSTGMIKEGADYIKYQFGLSGRSFWRGDLFTGDMDDKAFGGMRSREFKREINGMDQRSVTRTYSLKTSFNLPEPIDLQISSIGLNWSQNKLVTPDTTKNDSGSTFPDLSISARTGILNKIPLISNNVQSVSATSTYSYLKKKTTSVTADVKSETNSQAHSFSPLVGLDGTLKKWPVNITYSHNWSWKEDENTGNKLISKSEEHSNKLGVRYEISKAGIGKDEIKILMWTVPIKGRIATGLDGEYSTTVVATKSVGSPDDFKPTAVSNIFSLSPNVSYDFTDNLTGAAKYTGSQKKIDLNTTQTLHVFSLSVELRF